jgi:hypothetical protein
MAGLMQWVPSFLNAPEAFCKTLTGSESQSQTTFYYSFTLPAIFCSPGVAHEAGERLVPNLTKSFL